MSFTWLPFLFFFFSWYSEDFFNPNCFGDFLGEFQVNKFLTLQNNQRQINDKNLFFFQLLNMGDTNKCLILIFPKKKPAKLLLKSSSLSYWTNTDPITGYWLLHLWRIGNDLGTWRVWIIWTSSRYRIKNINILDERLKNLVFERF